MNKLLQDYIEINKKILEQFDLKKDDIETIEKNYYIVSENVRNLKYILAKTIEYKNQLSKLIDLSRGISHKHKFLCTLEDDRDDRLYSHKINVKEKKVMLTPNVSLPIKVVENIHHIPETFYWYGGDNKTKAGIYMAISNTFYIEVPFPQLFDRNSKYFKHNTSICRHGSRRICKLKYYSHPQSQEYICNFAHTGEKLNKIGTEFRAPNMSSFGCHDTIIQDIGNIGIIDIRRILMNAASDILLIKLWYETNHKNRTLVLTDLDVA